jgi:TonB-dependent starch-binding outer membrane protein SusC
MTVKCTILMLFLCSFRVSANFTQGNTLSLILDNTSIKSVLKEVEKQTDYTFLYDNSKVNVTRDVSVSFKDEKIESVLNKLFAGTDIIYRIEGKQIILGNRVENTKFQEFTVTGKVVDLEHNEALPGVTVMIKGTSKGTTTDISGKFSLQVPDKNATLVFQFVGYLPEEIVVGSQTVINVSLAADIQQLSEVVVIGYGTQKKKELTSAVSSVKSEDFNKGAITQSPLQVIQGKIAGLNISKGQGGSDPTNNLQMQIRGVSTLQGDPNPLVVIDGVPGGNLNTVSPEDIESVDVLRDGSAAAIYGTKGTNGVILITTKKGKAGAPTFEYSVYAYTERFAKKPDILTSSEYRAVTRDPAFSTLIDSTRDYGHNTDWLNEITQKTISQVHNFAVSGGKDQTTYYASVNYRELNGFVKRSYNKILNGRVSISTVGLKDKLSIQASISGTSTKYRPTDYNVYQSAFEMNPTAPVYDTNGKYWEPGGSELLNPVMLIYTADDDQSSTQMLSSLRATLEMLPGLKFSIMGSMQRINWMQGYYQYQNRYPGGQNGYAVRNDTNSTDRNLEATLNYTHKFSAHSINLMGGYSYQDQTAEGFGASNSGYVNDAFTYNNLNAGLHLNNINGQSVYTNNDVHSNKFESILISFFGRAMWSYNDKYMASVSVRREGSSKFGANNKWGTFPAVSAGWRISKESFMQGISWLSDLKLRVGYGVTGNQGVLPYQSLESYSSGNPVQYKGVTYNSNFVNNNNNPDLKWETKTETNIGLDMGFLQSRLNGTLDLYKRTTKGALWEYPVSQPPFPAPYYWDNVGEITNQGIELGINASPVKKSKFTWNTNFTFSYNKNKVVTIAGTHVSAGHVDFENIGSPNLTGVSAFRLEDGQPVGNMYGFKYAGVDENGKWQFWDSTNTQKLYLDQDPKVGDKDKRIIGNGLPKYWVGWTNNFTYGHFDLSFMLRGAFGFDIFNVQRLYFENKNQLPRNVFNSALTSPVDDNPAYSDYYIEKGNYLKIDNLALGYSIPVKKQVLQKARIYFSVSNLYTFTNYKGTDPELPISGFAPGIDRRASYPSTRIFTLGLNVTF